MPGLPLCWVTQKHSFISTTWKVPTSKKRLYFSPLSSPWLLSNLRLQSDIRHIILLWNRTVLLTRLSQISCPLDQVVSRRSDESDFSVAHHHYSVPCTDPGQPQVNIWRCKWKHLTPVIWEMQFCFAKFPWRYQWSEVRVKSETSKLWAGEGLWVLLGFSAHEELRGHLSKGENFRGGQVCRTSSTVIVNFKWGWARDHIFFTSQFLSVALSA